MQSIDRKESCSGAKDNTTTKLRTSHMPEERKLLEKDEEGVWGGLCQRLNEEGSSEKELKDANSLSCRLPYLSPPDVITFVVLRHVRRHELRRES